MVDWEVPIPPPSVLFESPESIIPSFFPSASDSGGSAELSCFSSRTCGCPSFLPVSFASRFSASAASSFSTTSFPESSFVSVISAWSSFVTSFSTPVSCPSFSVFSPSGTWTSFSAPPTVSSFLVFSASFIWTSFSAPPAVFSASIFWASSSSMWVSSALVS
uniref:Uncharacterized protein n=1 Tax=Opuntia streptacantha TaxID=393608 RepID=A0A7C9A7Y3_OPUST